MSLPNWLLLIVMPLGVARATWLIMSDKVTEKPRDWIERRGGYFGYFIGCPWCVSMWVATAASALVAWDYTRPLAKWLCVIGTLSIITVLIERVIDRTALLRDDPTTGTIPDYRAEAEAPDAVRAILDRQ